MKQYGILFGIASGRPVETVRAMLKEWQIEDSVSFIMGMNGGVLYDLRQRSKRRVSCARWRNCIRYYSFL